MKVILCENVPNVGEIGATVKVSEGYARNYLLPRKLAVPAESGSARHMEHQMRIIRRREEKLRAEMAGVASKLENTIIEIKAKAGEEGRLFGSVTSAQIAAELKALGHEVDRRSITIQDPIKSLGEHTVSVRLTRGVDARITIRVKPELEPDVVAEPEAEVAADAETEASPTEAHRDGDVS